jgi:hypothetical protein
MLLTCGFRSRCAKDSACIISSPEMICSAISRASTSGILPDCATTYFSRSPRGMYSMARNTSKPSLNQPKNSTNTAASLYYALSAPEWQKLAFGLENSNRAFNSFSKLLWSIAAPAPAILFTALAFPASLFLWRETSPNPPRPKNCSTAHICLCCFRRTFRAGSDI